MKKRGSAEVLVEVLAMYVVLLLALFFAFLILVSHLGA